MSYMRKISNIRKMSYTPLARVSVGITSVGIVYFGTYLLETSCNNNSIYGNLVEEMRLARTLGMTSSIIFIFTGVDGLSSSFCKPKNIRYIPKRLLASAAIQALAFAPILYYKWL
jgi:hypothetical protein